eukprot:gene5904-6499_t
MDERNEELANQFLESLSKKVDSHFQPLVVFPGQDVTSALLGSTTTTSTTAAGGGGGGGAGEEEVIKIGPGLIRQGEKILAIQAGKLNYRPPASYWIDSSRKKYLPRVGDQVVGVIEEKGGEFYMVNIFSGTHTILNRLSFEGATKRNRPELKRGDVIYARVITAGKDCDTELSCIASSSGARKEWSSGETVYGQLPQGLIVRLPLPMARHLLRPDCAVVNALGRYLAYELAVGMNGAVWMRSAGENQDQEEILLRNALLNAETLTDIQAEAMVDQLFLLASKRTKR